MFDGAQRERRVLPAHRRRGRRPAAVRAAPSPPTACRPTRSTPGSSACSTCRPRCASSCRSRSSPTVSAQPSWRPDDRRASPPGTPRCRAAGAASTSMPRDRDRARRVPAHEGRLRAGPDGLTHSNTDLRIRALLDYAVGPRPETLPPGYAPLPTRAPTPDAAVHRRPSAAHTTTTTTTLPPAPVDNGSVGSTDFSSGSTDYTSGSSSYVPPASTVTNTTTKSSSNHVVKVTQTVVPKQVKFVAISLPDTGDRFALPVVFGLALLALLGWGVDIAYRRLHRRTSR